MSKEIKFQPEAGLIIVMPLVVEPKKTIGKTEILRVGQKQPENEVMEDVFDEHPFQAKVIRLGNPFKDEPVANVVPGDIVYLNRQLGNREAVLIDKVLYAYIRRSDIIGKVTK